MHTNRFIVFVSFTVSALVALFTLLGSLLDYGSISTVSGAHIPMSSPSALLMLGMSIGLLLLSLDRPITARFLAGFAIVVAVFLSLVAFGVIPQIVRSATEAEDFQMGNLIPLNALLALTMLSLSLLILSYSHLSEFQKSMALVCSLLALSISILAVFGYVVGIEFAYWWPSSRELGSYTAVGLLTLSIGFIAMCWHRFSTPAAHSSEVLVGIQIASGSILFVTVLLCGSLALIPFYESLLQKVYDEAKNSVEAKRLESSLFFTSIQMLADSAMINSGTQDLTQAFSKAGPFPGIRELSYVPQAGALEGAGKTLQAPANEVGQFFSRPSLKFIVEPFGNDSGRLLVEAPVFNAVRQRIGTLTAVLDLGFLSNLLCEHIPFSSHQGSFYLLADSRTDDTRLFKVTVSSRAVEFIVVEKAPAELLRALSPDTMQELSPSQAILNRDIVSFLSPLKGVRAYLGFVSRVYPFRNLFHERLISVVSSVVLLLLSGTGFIFFLMRKLGRQVLTLEGRVRQSLAAVADELTLRQQAQAEIERSLEEKEVLLKEIHHRVKNNLQVISSILSLQLRRTERPEVAEVLRDSADRIQSIALLHETLYRSSNFSSIDLADYFAQLTRHLSQSYNIHGTLRTQIETHGLTLEIDRAIPLGLILTELTTNSLKYAFGGLENGSQSAKIIIDCSVNEAGQFVLDYRDTGKGLPADFSLESPNSLGTRLISILVRQLKGEIVYSSENGAHFRLTFLHFNNRKEVTNEKAANSDC